MENAIQVLEAKLENWSDYEVLKEHCLAWIRDTDTKLHSIDLKATADDKKNQFEQLKVLQGEIRAKEFEIDQVTEKAQQLNKGLMGRPSQISEIGVKYQQVMQKVKDLTSRWQQYVNNHQDFDSKIVDCQQWINDIKEKISYCSEISESSQQELQSKLETIQEHLLRKEEGFGKIQNLVELAQIVLANTAPEGHQTINKKLSNMQEEWSNLASLMVETKSILEDSLTKWSQVLDEIKTLNKSIEWMENEYEELAQPHATLTEKKTQLGRIKTLEDKVRGEKVEVDHLKTQVASLLRSKSDSEGAIEGQSILSRFETVAQKIFVSTH